MQAFIRAIGFAIYLLFVGCGEGLLEPHLESLLSWLSEVTGKMPERNYRLALRREVPKLRKLHETSKRIQVLAYGDGDSDLASFLKAIAPAPSKAKANKSQTLGPAWKEYMAYLTRETATMPLAGLWVLGSLPRFRSMKITFRSRPVLWNALKSGQDRSASIMIVRRNRICC